MSLSYKRLNVLFTCIFACMIYGHLYMVREVKTEKVLFFFPSHETPFTGLENICKRVIPYTTGIVLKGTIGKTEIHILKISIPKYNSLNLFCYECI